MAALTSQAEPNAWRNEIKSMLNHLIELPKEHDTLAWLLDENKNIHVVRFIIIKYIADSNSISRHNGEAQAPISPVIMRLFYNKMFVLVASIYSIRKKRFFFILSAVSVKSEIAVCAGSLIKTIQMYT